MVSRLVREASLVRGAGTVDFLGDLILVLHASSIELWCIVRVPKRVPVHWCVDPTGGSALVCCSCRRPLIFGWCFVLVLMLMVD